MSDLDQHDDIHDLLVGAPAPRLHYDLDATLRTGQRIRARRRLAAAGGGVVGLAAAATALALVLPGTPSASVAPAGPSLSGSVSTSPSPSASVSTRATTQCFPDDSSAGRTPWLTATAPGVLPTGGAVTVTAEILSGCSTNVLAQSESAEGKGATEVTLGLTERPTTASWIVANAAVLILPKGQRPCGYSFADSLPAGVTVTRGEWDVVVQPIDTSLLNKAASSGTVDICKGDSVVTRDLPQISEHDLGAKTDRAGAPATCDLDELGTAQDSARTWARHTVPAYLGKADVAVEVRAHPGAGCTGEGVTEGPLSPTDPTAGVLLEVDVPEVPTAAFWDFVHAGDQLVAAFFLPAGQDVCDVDFSGTELTGRQNLADATDIALDSGWTLQLQPLPDTNRSLELRARVCTPSGVVTPSLAPLSAG
ncbi:hypothetical protein GCM10022415_22110 [Knoellia locipacati]|uniref:Uncharacterized protein n=1 Tax=Knoellia locipacati TaxID=882824 RepID=A0A512T1T9_9MICO|nr:hypothetical protein [Knoellia locipacati]GEQ14160.1 hypothetical protein KLO01_22070 [Knoellia locipacati]